MRSDHLLPSVARLIRERLLSSWLLMLTSTACLTIVVVSAGAEQRSIDRTIATTQDERNRVLQVEYPAGSDALTTQTVEMIANLTAVDAAVGIEVGAPVQVRVGTESRTVRPLALHGWQACECVDLLAGRLPRAPRELVMLVDEQPTDTMWAYSTVEGGGAVVGVVRATSLLPEASGAFVALGEPPAEPVHVDRVLAQVVDGVSISQSVATVAALVAAANQDGAGRLTVTSNAEVEMLERSLASAAQREAGNAIAIGATAIAAASAMVAVMEAYDGRRINGLRRALGVSRGRFIGEQLIRLVFLSVLGSLIGSALVATLLGSAWNVNLTMSVYVSAATFGVFVLLSGAAPAVVWSAFADPVAVLRSE